MTNKRSFGKLGEELAARHLINSGLEMLTQNYQCPIGEMDIIARQGETLVFVEVRTRRSALYGWGEESITYQKAKRLRAIAAYYIRQAGYQRWPCLRFDVIAIRWSADSPEIKWIQAAL